MKVVITLLSLSLPLLLQAQLIGEGEKASLRKGNRAYDAGDYASSTGHYEQALKYNTASQKGFFNLGDALYAQDEYQKAAKQFELAAKLSEDNALKAQAFHNQGNALLKEFETTQDQQRKGQALGESIEAYKNALRMNPSDADTRYNLAYAQRLQQQNQNQNGDNNQNQDQNQDQQNQDQNQQNQDQQNQDQQNQQQNQDQQNQQNQDQQQQDNQQQQGQNQQNQQQQGKPTQMSKEDIERMLEQLLQQENKVQEKVQKRRIKVKPGKKPDKDW